MTGAVSDHSPSEGDGGGQLMGGWGSSGEGTAVSIEKVLVIILPVLTMLAVFYIIVTLAIRLFQVNSLKQSSGVHTLSPHESFAISCRVRVA